MNFKASLQINGYRLFSGGRKQFWPAAADIKSRRREKKEREPPHKNSCCRLLGGYAPSLLFLLHRLPNFFREWIRDSQKLHYVFLEVIGIDFTKCILAVKSFMSGRFQISFQLFIFFMSTQ